MKKTFIHLAITSCFVLGTTLAYANPGSNEENMADKMYKDMDTNSDGVVTKEEFNSFGAKKFTEMDVNGDGQITRKEMKGAKKKMDGSGSVRNKMDDDGMDPTGKERSTKMSGERDHKIDSTSSGGTQGDRSSSQGRGGSRSDSSGSGSSSYGTTGGSSDGSGGESGGRSSGNSGGGSGGGH